MIDQFPILLNKDFTLDVFLRIFQNILEISLSRILLFLENFKEEP